MSDQVKIIDYLLTRLHQVGVTKVLGVPGDFNLTALDSLESREFGVEWIGCANELNAAYAADGYARVKEGLGVIFTTFGVGELSAVNGIAGCFSERVPVLHIVGVPSTGLQSKKALLHHTLGDGRFDAYTNIYKNITIAQANLDKRGLQGGGNELADEIDRVITQCLRQCRPTYLTLPTDLVAATISGKRLKDSPLTLESIRKSLREPQVEEKVEKLIIKRICERYEKAKKPIVLVDACCIRYGVQKETQELIEKTGMTYFTSPMGKTAIDERHPQFGGIYVGEITKPEVKEAVESSDLIIYVGRLSSDFNTGSFSWHLSDEETIELHSDHTSIGYAEYANAGFQSLLPKLIPAMEKVAQGKDKSQRIPPPTNAGLSDSTQIKNSGKNMMVQDEFWPAWERFLQPGDVVLAETGTSNFGILDTKFPSKSNLVSQILYGSIGWATGATLGAALAAKEAGRRTILFTGDGSLQLTVQEISTMVRQGLKPILVVLNNGSYVIEKEIHGRNASYNVIQNWAFEHLLPLFNPAQGTTATYRVENRDQLEALFDNTEFAKAEKLQLVEVMLGANDAPRALREQAAMTEKANAEA